MPTSEELIKAIRTAYDAMFSEYMSCPWCTGTIGLGKERHDDYCIWLRVKPQPVFVDPVDIKGDDTVLLDFVTGKVLSIERDGQVIWTTGLQ